MSLHVRDFSLPALQAIASGPNQTGVLQPAVRPVHCPLEILPLMERQNLQERLAPSAVTYRISTLQNFLLDQGQPHICRGRRVRPRP